jgi:putative peptidoglycan lipid II flippase
VTGIPAGQGAPALLMTEPTPAAEAQSVTRAAVRMGGVTVASRLMGFVRVLVIAAVLGTTYLGNTFEAANSVSNVLFELLAAGALSMVLVPTFVTLIDAHEDREVDRLASGLIGYAVAVMGAIAVLGIIFSPWLARLLSSGAPNAHVAAQQRSLATFLLWFFMPQVILYAFGAVATALLYAKRHFAITAAAPIGNSVVIIACMFAFRAMNGPDPTFTMTTQEKILLAVAGTGGVLAFVGILMVAARRAGFSLRPRWHRHDPALARLSKLAVWGVLLHSGAALLLGASLVAGNGVAGGVVAYQVAFVFFLAPYAVLAQPIQATTLPEMAIHAGADDLSGFARSTRWALDRTALLVIPVSLGLVAIALPAMRLVAFGSASETGPGLLAAGLASLAVGLYPYSAFLLLARSWYALGDGRTPAIVAIGSALLGVAIMLVGSLFTHGSARVAILGFGHSGAYLVGAIVLGVGCARRTGQSIMPTLLPISFAIAGVIALVSWVALRALDPSGRPATVACLALVGALGTGLYVLAVRRWWRTPAIAAGTV